MTRFQALVLIFLGPALAFGQEPPRTVEALFSNLDPRKEALTTKVVREWKKDGIV